MDYGCVYKLGAYLVNVEVERDIVSVARGPASVYLSIVYIANNICMQPCARGKTRSVVR